MPKKKTKKSISAKDARRKKARMSAMQRARTGRTHFPIDFGPMSPDGMNPQALSEHLPLAPAHTHVDPSDGSNNELPRSPARTWLEMSRAGGGEEALEVVERWPFRLVRAGRTVSPNKGWSCLRLLALGTKENMRSLCDGLIELEDASLQTWDPRTNAYVLAKDVPETSHMSRAEALV
ncbi:hypothetical protein BQ8420_20405 [Nocardiopsis sp. JB363]|nr:hypothetical protein BQ8420_20405 [Nocardiopsis sp. JB363]